MFTERELRRGLKTKTFGNKIYTFQTIDSTNNCGKVLAGVGATEGVVVIAEEQTAGKGRLGRTWQANAGENLTFSLLLRPRVSPDVLNLLPLYVAVAAAEAIERASNLRIDCKWPNDLLVNNKKIGGILIEGSVKDNLVEHVVIGLGINVNQTQFSGDFNTKATSLRLESREQIDRTKLFREIISTLETRYKEYAKTAFRAIIPLWEKRSTMLGKSILVSQSGNVFSGTVRGLSPEGGLVLETNGSTKVLFAGDVTILGDTPEQLFPMHSSSPSALAASKV